MAWCLSTTCLCCTALSCQMHPAAKQLCELSQGTQNDPDSLRYLWAALLIWMLLQWNIGQSSSRLFFFFFLRVVVVSHGRVPGLQLHLLACLCFLAPPGFSRIRFIYILKPREELSRCHANLSGWLSWNCVALIWWLSWSLQSLHSAHRRKYFLKSASFFHFNMFSSIFLSHSFSDTELAQWRKQAIVKHFIWHHRHIY